MQKRTCFSLFMVSHFKISSKFHVNLMSTTFLGKDLSFTDVSIYLRDNRRVGWSAFNAFLDSFKEKIYKNVLYRVVSRVFVQIITFFTKRINTKKSLIILIDNKNKSQNHDKINSKHVTTTDNWVKN